MHVALVGAEFEENLAVRYLQGSLEQAGHQVTSILFNQREDIERAARQIVDAAAPITGLSMVFTYRAREFADLAVRARALGYTGHIVAGGHFAALHADPLLEQLTAIDSVALGEGEPLLDALTLHLDTLHEVPGLVWRCGDRIVRTLQATKPPDLDALAWPPRKSPFDHYLGIPITNILSSRGCTHACAFCSIAAWHRFCGGDRLRLRTPDHVAAEMASLYRQGIRIFNFHDDNFVLDDQAEMRARMDAWDASLRQHGVPRHIAFAIKCRPDVVDRALFSKLVGLGLFRVFLGVEAGTSLSLRQLGRGQTVTDNDHALQVLNDLDVHTCFNLLVFNPDSTLEDAAANVAFLRRHPHNPMNFCRTEIYAGTPLERRLRKQGRLLGDFWGYDYVMADPRAQHAFEIIYPAFEARNYGDEGLHHITMQIDYEQQLLRRFFGPHDALRRRVKDQIVQVNLNTCDHLDAVMRAVPGLASDAARERYAREVRAHVEEDNAALGREVQALLDEIRHAALRPQASRTSSKWVRAAATAGLAASVGLAVGCREKSHTTEMAAAPPQTTAGPPPDAAPEASGADAATTPPVGPPALVKPRVSEIRPLLARKIVPAEPVELEIWIDRDGKVSKALVLRPEVPDQAKEEIVAELRAMRFTDPAVMGQRFVVYFSKEEVTNAGQKPPAPTATHVKERIPPRPEMAPRPPPPPRPEMIPYKIKR
jgi:radical SAM superfamily enzyme YgiQ (UPF0313 family)